MSPLVNRHERPLCRLAVLLALVAVLLVTADPSEAARNGKGGYGASAGRVTNAKSSGKGGDMMRVGARKRANQGNDGEQTTDKPPKGRDKPPVLVRRHPKPEPTEPKPPRHATPQCDGGKIIRDHCACPPKAILRHGHCVASGDPSHRRPPVVVTPPPNVLPPAVVAPVAAMPAFVAPDPPKGGPTGAMPGPTSPPSATPPAQSLAQFAPDEMLVTVGRNTPQSLWRMIARTHRVTLIEQATLELADARIVRCRVRDGRSVPAVVAALQADPRVGNAQPNYYYRFQQGAAPQAATGLQYALAKLDATAAHQLARGRGATVAVIDSGIDRTHPDLEASVAAEFDAVGDARITGQLDSHGTAVAGIISGHGTVQGVAPGARLLSVRAFKPGGSGATATGTTLTIMKGMDWAMAQGARVLNLSFGGPIDPLLEKAILAAIGRRAIVVAAAGNNGPAAPPVYPAAYEPVIAVTATDAVNNIYAKANRGAYIDLAAPGVDILTLAAGKRHEYQSGTSFAAAHVSGIVALMLELDPSLDLATVQAALLAGAMPLGDGARREEFGAGLSNAAAALRLVASRSQ